MVGFVQWRESLSHVKNDIVGTVQAVGGVQGSAGGLRRGGGVAALGTGRVAVVGRELSDVVWLRVGHLQVAADALRLSEGDVSETFPEWHPWRQSQRGIQDNPTPAGTAVLRLLPWAGHHGNSGRSQILFSG